MLAGVFEGPEGAPAGVVVCHPHPLYGGTKESTVVRLVAEACAGAGLLALRFDFRGVGESGGRSEAGLAERDDAAAAIDALAAALPPGAPTGIAGYSFGAWVAAWQAAGDERVAAVALVAPVGTVGGVAAPDDALAGRPALAVAAEHDHLNTPEDVARLLARLGGGRVETVTGADHLFHGYAEEAAAHVAGFMTEALAGARTPPAFRRPA